MVRKGLEEGITLRYAISIKMLRLGDYISYPLSKASCKISKELTGWARDQNFQTENLGWRLDEIDGKLVLVADDATRSTLILRGKIGCDRGIEAIDTMQKALYTNKELAQAIVPMKEEMWKQLQECNQCNQETTRRHWIDSPHNSTHEGDGSLRVCYMHNGLINNSYLYSSNGDTYKDGNGIRPVVFLKSDIILIDGDGSKEKPYVI